MRTGHSFNALSQPAADAAKLGRRFPTYRPPAENPLQPEPASCGDIAAGGAVCRFARQVLGFGPRLDE
jgi:hypothetical protein